MGADTKAAAPNDEIAEIMNEIQSLQQSMAAHVDAEPTIAAAPEAAPAAIGEPQALDEFRGSADDASMEETLANLKEEPAPNSLLDGSEDDVPSPASEPIEAEMAMEAVQAEADFDTGLGIDDEEDSERKYTPSRARAASSSYESDTDASDSQDGALTLTLSGKMTLKLKYEFEGQDVKIQFRDGCLHVELMDGTEFKVPVASRRLKAA